MAFIQRSVCRHYPVSHRDSQLVITNSAALYLMITSKAIHYVLILVFYLNNWLFSL